MYYEKSKIKEEIFRLQEQIFELPNRTTGRTTRMVDSYIQKLFKNPNDWIPVYDHEPTKQASNLLVDKIKKRLDFEHKLEVNVKSIENGFAIKLKNYTKPDFSQHFFFLKENLNELINKLNNIPPFS